VENYSRYTMARLGMSQLAGIEQQLKPEYGPVMNDVTSFNYPITISPCQNRNVSINENSVFIAVIIWQFRQTKDNPSDVAESFESR
jgi:hypothetical protein